MFGIRMILSLLEIQLQPRMAQDMKSLHMSKRSYEELYLEDQYGGF